MKTLYNVHKYESKYIEPCCSLPSQIEPDGATSLREVIKQYMSGVPVHQISQPYFDFSGLNGGLPDLDLLPQLPDCKNFEEVFVVLEAARERTLAARAAAATDPTPAPPPTPAPAPAPAPPAPPEPPAPPQQ